MRTSSLIAGILGFITVIIFVSFSIPWALKIDSEVRDNRARCESLGGVFSNPDKCYKNGEVK